MTTPGPADRSMGDAEALFGTQWLAAAARADVRADLEAVYALVASRVHERTHSGGPAPTCWSSGRCCQFASYGHRLYVTGLEAAYTLVRLPEIAGTRPDNFRRSRLTVLEVERAGATGTCALQVRNLCGVHPIKPLGCRIYFCDRATQTWQHELTEETLGLIKSLHDRHGLEYRYGEWNQMLRRVLDAQTDPPADGLHQRTS